MQKSKHPWRYDMDSESIIARFTAGESVLDLSRALGVSRSVIVRTMREHRVSVRSRSEAIKLAWKRRDQAQRLSHMAPAHRAVLGRRQSLEERIGRALTVQARTVIRSKYEISLREMLTAAGVETIPQQAVGPYNCDLGAFPIAVEVFGGNWHFFGTHASRAPERLRYFLDRGWSVVMVVVSRDNPLDQGGADYCRTFIEQTRSNPTARREYRMIRGTGELLASGYLDGDHITVISAPERGYRLAG